MRHALTSLPFLVLLASPALAQSPDAPVEMPAEMVADRFFVEPVTADGDTLRFYTDTGGGLFVYADIVEREGLAVDTLASGGDTLRVARLGDLDEEAWIPSPTSGWGPGLPILERDPDRPSMGGEDGMLGQAWFADRVWTLDYPAGRLVLHPEGAALPAGADTAPLGFLTDSLGNRPIAFPRIQAVVEGDTLDFLFDTGATAHLTETGAAGLGDGGPATRATSFVTTEVFDRWRVAHPDWRVIENADRTVDSMAMIEVPGIQIAGHVVGPVWFTQRPDRAFHEYMAQWMDRPTDGALGGNALRFFRVTVDYPGAVAAFERVGRSAGAGVAPAGDAPGGPDTLRRATYEAIVGLVDGAFFDPDHLGIDWTTVAAGYADGVDAVESDDAFRRLMTSMLREIPASHMDLLDPPSGERDDAGDPEPLMKWSAVEGAPGVLHVRIRSFGGLDPTRVEELMAEAGGAGGLILDVRGNEGGDASFLNLAGRFFVGPARVGGLVTRAWLEAAGHPLDDPVPIATFEGLGPPFTVERLFELLGSTGAVAFDAGTAATYPGCAAVLIDGRTGSAAEAFTLVMEEEAGVPLFGATTAGALLSSQVFDLPNGMRLRIPVAVGVDGEGRIFWDDPIEPDVPVDPAGDAAVEAAVDAIAACAGAERTGAR